MGLEEEEDAELDRGYARSVGERLRMIRRQQGLSLQTVEERSNREFKASVVGAYERGERIISVLRLQRLAQLYAVPIDQLLPRETNILAGIPSPEGTPTSSGLPVTLDVLKLNALDAPEGDVLRRYVRMLQIQRGDFNGQVMTIRDEDVRSLGRVFERDELSMRQRLDELGLRA